MKFFFDSTRLVSRVAAGSFVIAALVAPQALAQDAALEQKVRQLEKQVQSIQAKGGATSSGYQGNKNHMLFFRGGFTHAMNRRKGSSIRSSVVAPGGDRADKDGFYVGAGLDWNLTDDVWGILPRTSVFAELMFEYKEFSNKVQGNAVLSTSPSALVAPGGNPRNVTVSQFTLSAAPKIKFMEGSKVRPWIIPAGLAIHVVSPTSESVTYLSPGIMFGAGVDYNIWKDFYVGIDGRYNLTSGDTDGVKVDGMTAGAYLGIGF